MTSTPSQLYTPCDPFISLIVRAADDGLSEEEKRQLDAHVANCAGCREALADQRDVHLQLSSAEEEFAPPGFEAAVMNALRADSPWAERWNWRVWTWSLAPIAAVFALLAVGVVRTAWTTAASSNESTAMTAAEPGLDLASLGSSSGQAPVASALWSASVSDASLLSLVLTAKADDPLATHLKDK